MRDGEVVKYKTTRGVAGIWREFERFILAEAPADRPVRVGIAHAQAPEAAARLSELVVRLRPDAGIERVCAIGAVVGTHSGPGAFGLLLLPDA